jgi:hypothetical protein
MHIGLNWVLFCRDYFLFILRNMWIRRSITLFLLVPLGMFKHWVVLSYWELCEVRFSGVKSIRSCFLKCWAFGDILERELPGLLIWYMLTFSPWRTHSTLTISLKRKSHTAIHAFSICQVVLFLLSSSESLIFSFEANYQLLGMCSTLIWFRTWSK